VHSLYSVVVNMIMRRTLLHVYIIFWLLFYRVQLYFYLSVGFGPYDGAYCLFNYQVARQFSFFLEYVRLKKIRFMTTGEEKNRHTENSDRCI